MAVAQFGNHPLAWLLRAKALRLANQPAEALSAIKHSIQLKETPEALSELILICYILGLHTEGRKFSTYLDKRFPKWTSGVSVPPEKYDVRLDILREEFDEQYMRVLLDTVVSSNTPRLIEEGYKGFSILRWKGRFYALAQSLGPVDLAQMERCTLNEYQESGRCVIGNSFEKTKHLLEGLGSLTPAVPTEHRPVQMDRLLRTKCLLAETILDYLDDKEGARNLEYLINSFGLDELRSLVVSLHGLENFDDLLRRLIKLQKEKIKRLLDPNHKTVAIYFPSCAYREHVGNIAKRLRNKGYNALTFVGTVCNDKYEKEEYVFYGGHGIVNQMDFVDVFIVPTLTFGLPQNAKKIYFVHDIHDSPIGNENRLLRLTLEFDYFFLPSRPVVDRVKRQVSKARNMFGKNAEANKKICLITGGYIKFDRNLEYFAKHKRNEKTLIYAPTVTKGQTLLEDIVSVPHYGDQIIETILNNFPDYDLIFRPHPHTLYTSEVQSISNKYKTHPRFIFDDNASFYMGSYSMSALMITDMSGTAYTYALTTSRPVVFFLPQEKEIRERFKGYRYFEDIDKIGCVANDTRELIEKIRWLLNNKNRFQTRIRDYRVSFLYNIGTSEDYFVDNLEYIMENKTRQDWVYL